MSDKNLNEWLFADIDDLIDCDYSNESKAENRMTDKEIVIEKTFSEELPYFQERIKEVFDNYNNPNGNEDPLYICVLRDSNRIVRKAEEEITRQQAEIEALITGQETLQKYIAKAKAEVVKEFTERLKNKIKTECNPYGKPTFDYDTSISIMRYIDNLVKEMVGGEK